MFSLSENNFFIDDDWTRDEIQAELHRVNTLINHGCLDLNGDIVKETVECQSGVIIKQLCKNQENAF